MRMLIVLTGILLLGYILEEINSKSYQSNLVTDWYLMFFSKEI